MDSEGKKSFKLSKGPCSLMMRDSSSNQMKQSVFTKLNAGIRFKAMCTPPINTPPHSDQTESLWDSNCGRQGLDLRAGYPLLVLLSMQITTLPLTVTVEKYVNPSVITWAIIFQWQFCLVSLLHVSFTWCATDEDALKADKVSPF